MTAKEFRAKCDAIIADPEFLVRCVKRRYMLLRKRTVRRGKPKQQ